MDNIIHNSKKVNSELIRAAIYVRVSTDKQEMENQILQLTPFCERSGWEIYEIYRDIISGKEEERPGFDKLFQDAHRKLFDVVLFWDVSRFSRAGLDHTIIKLFELKNLGIGYHSYTEPNVTTMSGDPFVRDINLSIMASLAKVQREQISRKTIAGMERVKLNGSRSGKPIGRPEAIPNIKERILDLWNAGKKPPEISRILGVKRGSVHYHINKIGNKVGQQRGV